MHVCLSLQSWVTEMAAYVKSLDPNHLLTVGEEGFYTSTANQTYCNPSSNASQCPTLMLCPVMDTCTAWLGWAWACLIW